jgi:hypothetical protein
LESLLNHADPDYVCEDAVEKKGRERGERKSKRNEAEGKVERDVQTSLFPS